MARPPAPGSVIVPDWHESAEGKEYLACILRKNRRRVFGKCHVSQPVTCHSLGRTVSPVAPLEEQRSRAVRACCTVPRLHPHTRLSLRPPPPNLLRANSIIRARKQAKPCQELLSPQRLLIEPLPVPGPLLGTLHNRLPFNLLNTHLTDALGFVGKDKLLSYPAVSRIRHSPFPKMKPTPPDWAWLAGHQGAWHWAVRVQL